MVAFTLCIVGFLIACLAREVRLFLGAMAYPTSLAIGLFPAGLWMHYCGAQRRSTQSNTLLLLGMVTFMAYRAGVIGLAQLPLSLILLLVVLPLELLLGKLILGCLAGSSEQRFTTEQ